MKNIFLIIAVFGMSVFFMSCTSILKCYCTTNDNVSQSRFESDLNKAIKDVGISGDCYDVEVKLRNNYGYRSVSCD
ncbi:MAG: hypothetical protein LBN27_06740 [Prevotellaceae bacterium]|jgi:hypothetical protein|nr:hypothetical protein [Prevotellaceae bacterium]